MATNTTQQQKRGTTKPPRQVSGIYEIEVPGGWLAIDDMQTFYGYRGQRLVNGMLYRGPVREPVEE